MDSLIAVIWFKENDIKNKVGVALSLGPNVIFSCHGKIQNKDEKILDPIGQLRCLIGEKIVDGSQLYVVSNHVDMLDEVNENNEIHHLDVSQEYKGHVDDKYFSLDKIAESVARETYNNLMQEAILQQQYEEVDF